MMGWDIILVLVLIFIYLAILLFFTIRDIIKHINYLNSQEVTNQNYYNDCDNSPKPDSVCLSEIISLNNKPYNKGYPNSCYYATPCVFIANVFRHGKSIIKRVTTKCK